MPAMKATPCWLAIDTAALTGTVASMITPESPVSVTSSNGISTCHPGNTMILSGPPAAAPSGVIVTVA